MLKRFMTQLIAIAAFVALVGGALFGYANFDRKNKQNQDIELVESSLPKPELLLPPTEPETQGTMPIAASTFQSAPIADPWETASSVRREEAAPDLPEPDFLESELEQTDLGSDRWATPDEIVLPPAIHDPRRPQTSDLENISQEILAWGRSKQLKHLPRLIQYVNHSSSLIRGYAALAIGEIAAPHTVKGEIEKVIPLLGKLTQDQNLQVRLFAIQALSSIQSEKGLPYLQKALTSPSSGVMQAANAAIQKLKLKYGIVAAAPPPKAKAK